uniref:AP-2 complex subunit alpha n=1 Tax=Blastobotrys adeninivorans TaxID=409370 RepID=A0A060TA02_BLAAD
MSQPMKGLVQFIADLRSARAREAEVKRVNQELANIRQKFRDSNLSGYNKKKYVCKLIYMYILGYEIDFGHSEFVSLLSSSKYSEKQVGYLAISLFLNENSPMLDMVLNSTRKDLQSLNDLDTCMALNCIATVGGATMAHALADDVFKLLISPTSPNFVRKKAALTLVRLYRKAPQIISPSWPDRIMALLDDPDIGVTTSVSSLVIALAQDDPTDFKMSYGKVVRRLQSLVFDKECPPEYMYYDVPCPWLYIKLFRLLQYYPPTEDETLFDALRKVIFRVIETNAVTSRNSQQNNAQNAVLFEAIALAIHIDVDPTLLERIVEALGEFLQSQETNVRYLSLSAMANLAARYEDIPVKRHLLTIIQSLKDRDISVRRKAVDLLYCLCDSANVKTIVNELLLYLQAADFAIREEMVIRIAVLVEKYATEFEWYIDISLRLISIAGNHVSDEVWQRVVQIVVNNEGLQAYAARTVLQYLKTPNIHETMVKVGGYILGEYGHLVAEEDGFAPLDQFLALHDKFSTCSVPTKVLLLTTYIKFANLFAEIKPQVLQVFEFHSTSYDSEIQQRACEYLRLANYRDPALLATVWDEIPPFPERTSALLTRMHSKYAHSEDKRVWALGNKQGQADRHPLQLDVSGAAKRLASPNQSVSSSTTSLPDTNGTANGKDSARPAPPMPRKSSSSTTASGTKGLNLLTSGWETGYKALLTRQEGMFYKDSLLHIGLRSDYRRHLGCVVLYFRNVSGGEIQSLSVELINPAGDSQVRVGTKNIPDSTLAPGETTDQVVIIDAKEPFLEAPRIKVTYMAGTVKAVTLKLPVILEKFMEPAPLDSTNFFTRWKQLTAPGLESQKVFKNMSASSTETAPTTSADDLDLIKSLNWNVIPNVDKNPNNIVGASVVHTSSGGNFGCLMRLEPNEQRTMYRVTVRTTDDRVGDILAKNIIDTYQL